MLRIIQHGDITTVALYHEEDDLQLHRGGKEMERVTFVSVRHEDDSYILKIYIQEKVTEYKMSQIHIRDLGRGVIHLLDARLFELENGPIRNLPDERGLDDGRRSEAEQRSPEATDSTRAATPEAGYEDCPF